MSGRPERSVHRRNVAIALTATAVVVALAFVWTRGRRAEPVPAAAGDPARTPTAAGEGPTPSPLARRWEESLGRPPAWPDDLAASTGCAEVRADLARVCAAVDARTTLVVASGGACALLDDLAEELAADPPDLSSELQSHDTMLGNVFHLYRIAGRERLAALRAALGHEELAEPAALALYRWALHHPRCAPEASDVLEPRVLYAYAGFLFNTMGGQAYLRRRPPRVEALACFYGLDALDRSIRAGHNPQGLDPRPEIARCRQLVASQPLLFAEHYLAALDGMARSWARTGP